MGPEGAVGRRCQLLGVLLSLAVAWLSFTTPAHAARASGCPDANRSALVAPAQTMREAVLCLVNQQRAHHRLPALWANSLLERSAQRWTDRMVRTGVFSHGADFASRITAVGFNWSAAGENIAAGFATPRAVVAAWMASIGHCQNILSPSYDYVGTGVNDHPLGPYGPGTWTQDFGLWMGQRQPSHNHRAAAGCPYRI